MVCRISIPRGMKGERLSREVRRRGCLSSELERGRNLLCITALLILIRVSTGEVAAINNCTKILTDPEGLYKLSGPETLKAMGDLSLYTTAEACPMVGRIPSLLRIASYHPSKSHLLSSNLIFSGPAVYVRNPVRRIQRIHLRHQHSHAPQAQLATNRHPLHGGIQSQCWEVIIKEDEDLGRCARGGDAGAVCLAVWGWGVS